VFHQHQARRLLDDLRDEADLPVRAIVVSAGVRGRRSEPVLEF
jgi:hypothetical protein